MIPWLPRSSRRDAAQAEPVAEHDARVVRPPAGMTGGQLRCRSARTKNSIARRQQVRGVTTTGDRPHRSLGERATEHAAAPARPSERPMTGDARAAARGPTPGTPQRAQTCGRAPRGEPLEIPFLAWSTRVTSSRSSPRTRSLEERSVHIGVGPQSPVRSLLRPSTAPLDRSTPRPSRWSSATNRPRRCPQPMRRVTNS